MWILTEGKLGKSWGNSWRSCGKVNHSKNILYELLYEYIVWIICKRKRKKSSEVNLCICGQLIVDKDAK